MTQDPEFLNDSDEWSKDSAWENFKEKNKAREEALMEEYREATREDNITEKLGSIRPPSNKFISIMIPEEEYHSLRNKIDIYESALRNIASITRIESDSAHDFFFAMSSMRKIATNALKEAEEL